MSFISNHVLNEMESNSFILHRHLSFFMISSNFTYLTHQCQYRVNVYRLFFKDTLFWPFSACLLYRTLTTHFCLESIFRICNHPCMALIHDLCYYFHLWLDKLKSYKTHGFSSSDYSPRCLDIPPKEDVATVFMRNCWGEMQDSSTFYPGHQLDSEVGQYSLSLDSVLMSSSHCLSFLRLFLSILCVIKSDYLIRRSFSYLQCSEDLEL